MTYIEGLQCEDSLVQAIAKPKKSCFLKTYIGNANEGIWWWSYHPKMQGSGSFNGNPTTTPTSPRAFSISGSPVNLLGPSSFARQLCVQLLDLPLELITAFLHLAAVWSHHLRRPTQGSKCRYCCEPPKKSWHMDVRPPKYGIVIGIL